MLPLRAVADGMSSGAARVTEEPGAAATDRVVVKEEALIDEEAEVKTEPPCEDGAGGASETAEPAGAACDLDVKDELEVELGPLRVQARDTIYALHVAAVKQEGGQEPRDDCLRLLTGEKLHPCDICGKYFLNLVFLHRHQQEHAGPEPARVSAGMAGSNRVNADRNSLTCETCKKQFSQMDRLVAHRQMHTEQPYSCDVCSKEYYTGHIPFSCEICKKPFVYLCDLSRHTRVHTRKKPLICEICKKQFTVSRTLLRHMRTHSGQKPFSCEICDKKFVRSHTLTIHRRTHTGEKPYTCEICNKKFAQSSGLTVHRRTHTGEKL